MSFIVSKGLKQLALRGPAEIILSAISHKYLTKRGGMRREDRQAQCVCVVVWWCGGGVPSCDRLALDILNKLKVTQS